MIKRYSALLFLFLCLAALLPTGFNPLQFIRRASANTATPTPTPTATPTATAIPVCDCVQGGVSTAGSVAKGSWTSCTSDYRLACQVTMPKYPKHVEFQNQCSNTTYVQFNGITAASGQGLALYTASASVGNTIYDIASKSPAAIAPPGSSTGILLVPTGPLSLISDTGVCTHDVNILVY